jgi:hypothetical protein
MISIVGVNVAGTKPCFVGGRVDVTKAGPTVTAAPESTATEMHDVRSNVERRNTFLNMKLRKSDVIDN